MKKKPRTPEANKMIKQYADELLDKYHPGDDWTLVPLLTVVDGAHFRDYMRQQVIGDLLLADGESFSARTPEWYAENEGSEGAYYQPNLDMFANTEPTRTVGAVGLRIWGRGWDFEETDNWQRQIDIRFFHENSENGKEAQETLSLESFRYTKPYLFRSISSSGYSEMGYDGHNQKGRSIGKKQVKAFLDTVRFLEQYVEPVDIEPLDLSDYDPAEDDLDPKYWGEAPGRS